MKETSLDMTSNLIRSLRDDEQEIAGTGAQVVAHSCRERVVAQHIADMTFVSSKARTRWSFLGANVPVAVSLMVPFVIPVDEVQMKPRLMMAALITGAQTESFSWYRERAMFVNSPESLRARRSKKTTDVRPIVRDGSGSPQWCGSRRRRQGTIREHFMLLKKSCEVCPVYTLHRLQWISPTVNVKKNN